MEEMEERRGWSIGGHEGAWLNRREEGGCNIGGLTGEGTDMEEKRFDMEGSGVDTWTWGGGLDMGGRG